MLQTTYTGGFSTIEMLIAFSVGILFLASAMMIALSDPSTMRRYSLESGGAVALDTILDSNGIATSTNAIGSTTAALLRNWNTPINSTTDGFYTNTPTVSDISPCMKEITGSTNWNTLHTRSRTITFGTTLSSMGIARALGPGGCDPLPPTDWDNPENPHWETHPNDIDGTQSGLALATINGRTYVFMTTTHSSQKNDLWVIDATNESNPQVVSSLETGWAANTGGLVDIAVVTTSGKTYAYVIQNSATNQLQTIDVSNPTALKSDDIKATTSLQAYGINPSGTDPIPKVITYYDGKLYIGLYNTQGPELLVFDIRTNPAQPSFSGAIASGFNHSINDIVVRDNYAYLAIKPGTGAGAATTRELMIIDVSNATPVDTNRGYNASSTGNDTEGATALYAIGNTLYMGRERVSNASERDFYVFNISSSTNPVLMKSIRMNIGAGGSLGTPRIIDLIVQGGLGFFVTTDSSKPFTVFDVVSSSTGMIAVNSACDNWINLPKLVEIAYKNGFIYAANGNQAALNILHDQSHACTI